MDATTNPQPIVSLQQLGDPDAAACVGDFCAIPEHHVQAIVNRRIDENAV